MAKDLEQLVQDKIDRMENVPAEFLSKVEKEQIKIYKAILNKLDKVKRNSEGNIILNDYNINLLYEINDISYDAVKNSEYKQFVNDFIKEFDTQLDITSEYLDGITVNKLVIPKEAEYVVDLYKQGAYNDMFSKNNLVSQFAKPIQEVFKRAVTSEGSFVDMTESIREIILGDKEKQGRLHRYAGQIAWDAFAGSDRAGTKQLSEANDIVFFRFAGGILNDSRQFCIHRNNHYFHIKEIELWGQMKEYDESKKKFVTIKEWKSENGWKGMITGTNSQNIFTNLGGHNCRHSLIPVPISVVPKKDIKRVLDLGFIELSKKQKAILEIK